MLVNLDFFFFVILLSIDGFFVLFPSFCIFLVFSDILPAEPSTGSSLRMPGSTIKKNLLSLPGNTSFRKHKRFFFFFCSLFCFFLLFWNNNIQYNRRNSCRNNTGAAENQLDIIRKLRSCSRCGTKAVAKTQCNRNDRDLTARNRLFCDELDTGNQN